MIYLQRGIIVLYLWFCYFAWHLSDTLINFSAIQNGFQFLVRILGNVFWLRGHPGTFLWYTLPNDQQFNLEFQFKSVFKLEYQAEFGIQLGIPILIGIDLGECNYSW